jgi:hypothetical protein
MKIDKDVELAVREALAGAVAGEAERYDAAVLAIGRAGDTFGNKALDLVFAIDSTALFSIHEAQRPDDEQLQTLAQDFAEQEQEWSDIDEATARTFLTALADVKSPLEVLPVQNVMFAAFAIGGWLLSAFLPEDGKWTDFLDAILDRLESDA